MDVVEVNGKMYHEEELERAEKIILELWENVKEVVSNILETVTELVYTFIQLLVERGYTEEQAVEYLSTIIQNE